MVDWVNGISTYIGFLMPNPFLCPYIWFHKQFVDKMYQQAKAHLVAES